MQPRICEIANSIVRHYLARVAALSISGGDAFFRSHAMPILQTAHFTIIGTTPLLMHSDDVLKADSLIEWRQSPANKNLSRPGDDRSPAWSWQTYLYDDGEHVAMPNENIMVSLRQAGVQMILKKQKTYKEITQSGLVIPTEYCEFHANGKQIPIAAIHGWREKPFTEQMQLALDMGFSLFTKRVAVRKNKHIRVRPRFDKWSVTGIIHVIKPEITPDILSKLFDLAGSVGLCDWRPGCKTPGSYGMFDSQIVMQ